MKTEQDKFRLITQKLGDYVEDVFTVKADPLNGARVKICFNKVVRVPAPMSSAESTEYVPVTDESSISVRREDLFMLGTLLQQAYRELA